MATFVFDLLSVYFSGSLWGVYLFIGFCTLCLAGIIELFWSCWEV